MKKYCINVVFSSTNTRIGSMIRVVTKNSYNHVSLAFDDDLHKMYSFARYYKNAPFFAGFVEESALRYAATKRRQVLVKVCRIELSPEQYICLRNYLDDLTTAPSRYIYNLFSAAATPLRRRVLIRDTYTCIEFVTHVLCRYMLLPPSWDVTFHSISDLERELSGGVAFEGLFEDVAISRGWGNDVFESDRGRMSLYALTCRQIYSLFSRAVAS